MIVSELISQLEEASDGDPFLDFWVWWWGQQANPRSEQPPREFVEETIQSATAPSFSRDLSLALTLVPKGYRWRLERQDDGFTASVIPLAGDFDARVTEGRAAAPALCAAVLKSRLSYVNDVMRGRQ